MSCEFVNLWSTEVLTHLKMLQLCFAFLRKLIWMDYNIILYKVSSLPIIGNGRGEGLNMRLFQIIGTMDQIQNLMTSRGSSPLKMIHNASKRLFVQLGSSLV